MTQLEKIEARLNYLLSRLEQNPHEPSIRIQIAFLVSAQRRLVSQKERENA